jgi:hypothetical protein
VRGFVCPVCGATSPTRLACSGSFSDTDHPSNVLMIPAYEHNIAAVGHVRSIHAPELGAVRHEDLLGDLNELRERVDALKHDERFKDPAYEATWLRLCDAADGLHRALEGWPG